MRWQIQFDAHELEAKADALDQLCAEMDRVLQRRNIENDDQFSSSGGKIEEFHESNREVARIKGLLNKADVLGNSR